MQPYYDAHYVQAYLHARPIIASSGYTLSSTAGPSLVTSPQHRPRLGSWYQPGNLTCTYKGCSFTGSQKSLELHMMDRHLIYPFGWDKAPRSSDWDADPSLKGKKITIQGTNLSLDNPEDLKAWLSDRKKRFPTAERVEAKKRKLEEAAASGQLIAENLGRTQRKRNQTDDQRKPTISRRGRGHRGRGPRPADSGWIYRKNVSQSHSSQGQHPAVLPNAPLDSPYETEKGDVDDAPEVRSSKLAVDKANQMEEPCRPIAKEPGHHRKIRPPQPTKEPHNPFAARPTLLRNLLLPDIRMTISNLSQAIRFLVDNDFLQGVEEKPGGSDDKIIQVLEAMM